MDGTTCSRVTVLFICGGLLLYKLNTIRDGFAVVWVIWVVASLSVGAAFRVVGGLGHCGQHDQAKHGLPETLQQGHWRWGLVDLVGAAVASKPGDAKACLQLSGACFWFLHLLVVGRSPRGRWSL